MADLTPEETAALLRLTQHLVSTVLDGRIDDDCSVVGFSGEGRCIERAVAIRWQDGFADEVCQGHADRARKRPGVLVVEPKPHNGTHFAEEGQRIFTSPTTIPPPHSALLCTSSDPERYCVTTCALARTGRAQCGHRWLR